MFQLQHLTATPAHRVVAGKSYWLSPLTLGDLGEIERAIVENRFTLNASKQTMNRGEIGPTALAPSQFERWIKSPVGTMYVLWLAMRARHPEVTLAMVQLAVLSTIGGVDCGQALEATDEQPWCAEQPADWTGLFCKLARRYGWTPKEIAGLTLSQAQALIVGTKRTARRALLSRQAYRELCQSQRSFSNDRPGSAGSSAACEPCYQPSAPSARPPDADRFGLCQRLAGFRRGLPEIYSPLSATALQILIGEPNVFRRRVARLPTSRRRVNRRAPRNARRDTRVDRAIPEQVARQLSDLIEALRNAARRSEVILPPDRQDVRSARFQ